MDTYFFALRCKNKLIRFQMVYLTSFFLACPLVLCALDGYFLLSCSFISN